jgi:hypothetical protein
MPKRYAKRRKAMIYVNENIKNTYRVPQPEGRGGIYPFGSE